MKHHDLLLPKKILWILIILAIALVFSGAFIKIEHSNVFDFKILMGIGLFLEAIIYFVVIRDILKNNYTGKIYEIIKVVLFNFFGIFGFLFTREDTLNQIEEKTEQEKTFRKKMIYHENFPSSIMLLSFLAIPLGAIFKIYHIGGASVLLIGSFCLQGLAVLWNFWVEHLKSKLD
jgi:hypothetical protein